MQEFPGNSQKGRSGPPPPPSSEDRPKLEPITSAEAVPRKRGLGSRFKDTFIVGSARDTVGYMVTELFIPAIQDAVIDTFQDGIERLIKGDSPRAHRRGPTSGYSNVGRVDYQSISRPTPASTQSAARSITTRDRSTHNFGQVLIETRQEASDVLDMMYEILSRDGVVHVADLYELTNIRSSHVDMRWGWRSLSGARPSRAGHRWRLDLPAPEPLD